MFKKLSTVLNIKITANMLRHSFITYQYKEKKISDGFKTVLAKSMLHQPTTAEHQYVQEI